MEKENLEIRPPQRFINKQGKYKIRPKAVTFNIKKFPIGELIKRLHLNPGCPPGLGSDAYGGRADQLTLYNGPKWRQWLVRISRTRRNDPCPCGSGLKYKKCCLINPKENG